MAYRADIEIAVRGAQELKRLQNEVSATSKLVNQLNNYLENIGSGGIVRNINNLRDVVGRAAAAFNEAALGTDEATIAAKKYITATNELNTGLRERAELLKQITEQERKAKLAAAGVRETTQYAGPIGPGQASPVALSSQLRGRTEQILAERKGAKELEQVLAALEERRRLEANAMLNQKAASVALQAERKKEKFLAGSTQFAEPIGPGQASPVALASQLRGRTEQILAERKGRTELNAVLQDQFERERQLANSKLDAQAAKVQAALEAQANAAAESANQTQKLADRQQEFTQRTEAAARAARAQTAEFIRQQRLQKEFLRGQTVGTVEFAPGGPGFSGGFTGGQREAANAQAILKTKQQENAIRRETLQLITREELFEIKLNKVLERNAAAVAKRATNRKQASEAAGNAIIGGAFPLLFGQGLGAAVGGGAGGAIGGALGGSFGFGLSLVGTALGTAFDTAANAARDFAKALRGSGDATQSLETLLGGLNPQTRTLISNLQSSGQTARAAQVAFNELSSVIGRENTKALQDAGNGWDNFGKQVKTTLTLITAEVIKTFKEIERTNPQKGGFSIASFIGQIALQGEKRQQAAAVTPEAAQRAAGLQQETDQLRTQAALTTLSAKNNLDLFVYTSQRLAQQERISRESEIEYKFVQGQISAKERLILLDQSRLKTQIDLNAIERQRIEELQRRQEEAARRAEEAARKQEQTVKNILGLQIELTQVTLESADVDVTRTTTTQGQLAGLKESLRQQQERLNVEARILDLQLDQKLLSADISAKEKELLTSIYYQQRANLEGQAQAKARLLQLDIARLETARALAATEGPRQLQDIGQQRGGQLGRIQAQLANPLGGDTLEQLNQQLDQSARRYETLVPLERQLTDLQIERNAVASSASSEELGLLDSRITSTLSAIQLEQQYLSQIELSEQALLRQQQFMGRYGQLIQGVSNQIAGLMTTNLSEIIRGTKTAQQVFAEFLDAVGNALLQTAQQMIAQYIAIGIARIFAGLGGGGGGADMSKSGITEATLAPMRQYSMEGPLTGMAGGIGLANGGPVSVGQPYVVGERGPELFLPSTGGNVMSNNDLRSAMGSGSAAAGAPVLNMSFQTTTIGGVEYVSRDQLEQAMAATRRQAASDGAKRGMTMTLDKLQQSPGTRSRVGLR